MALVKYFGIKYCIKGLITIITDIIKNRKIEGKGILLSLWCDKETDYYINELFYFFGFYCSKQYL